MGTVLATFDGVEAGYGPTPVLRGLDLTIPAGRQLAILGGSGVGKSTLLRVLDGQLAPSAGTLSFPGGRPRQGVAFQQPLLYPWLTVEENIRLGFSFSANDAHHDEARVAALVDALGLEELRDAYPDEISGGQAQRCSLARALAVDPPMLLLDEPLSALDPATRSDLQHWLRERCAQRGTTLVLITHDIDEALIMADDIVLLGRHGRIQQRWVVEPAQDVAAAHVHPLRPEIRAAYDAAPGAAAVSASASHA